MPDSQARAPGDRRDGRHPEHPSRASPVLFPTMHSAPRRLGTGVTSSLVAHQTPARGTTGSHCGATDRLTPAAWQTGRQKAIPARGQNARVTAPPVHLGTERHPPKPRGARSSISGLSQQAQSSLKMLASTQSAQKERKLDPDHTNTSTNASTTRRVASFSETKRSYGLRMRSP